MCKVRPSSHHILNAQASIRAPCCKKWFDCAECHGEVSDHPLARVTEMAFLCKKCRKAFRKDMGHYEESDEYCPHCDNHYVIEAKTANAMLTVESEDTRVDNRAIRDERVKEGKIDTSELDEWLTQLDGAPGPAPEGQQ
ncbi:hypothetical protein JCM3770_000616 [Rhodotorula araucariae]